MAADVRGYFSGHGLRQSIVSASFGSMIARAHAPKAIQRDERPRKTFFYFLWSKSTSKLGEENVIIMKERSSRWETQLRNIPFSASGFQLNNDDMLHASIRCISAAFEKRSKTTTINFEGVLSQELENFCSVNQRKPILCIVPISADFLCFPITVLILLSSNNQCEFNDAEATVQRRGELLIQLDVHLWISAFNLRTAKSFERVREAIC